MSEGNKPLSSLSTHVDLDGIGSSLDIIFNPGDTLIVSCFDGYPSQGQMDFIKSQLEDIYPDQSRRVLFLPEGCAIDGVMHHEPAASADS